MKRLSAEFRRALYNQERNYLVYADITLANNTVLNLTNSDIWTSGFIYEESVSEDEQFTALGSVVIGSAQLIINNIYETYSNYDFTNAEVVLYLGMQFPDRLEKFKVGTYTVDETNYNGATIRLSLLDNLMYFDQPYSVSNLQYPATLDSIVRDICTKCGVPLNTYQFPNRTFTINTRPNDESITCREVLSWAAAIAGCYVKCNPDGQIELNWFDTASLENAEAELDGGTFNPWSDGTVYDDGTFTDARNVNYISGLYSQNIGMDDVVITGVTILVKDESSSATENIKSYTRGTPGYVIVVSDNAFITTTNADTIATYLGNRLIGLRFRKLSVSHANDPAIEAGDVGLVIDRKQHVYRTLITRIVFSVDSTQTTVCGATTPLRNSATRYSASTKSYVESRRWYKQEMTEREVAIQDLANSIASSSGLYTTSQSGSSGTIYYMHDKPNLSDSKIVWKMTAEAWAVTTNYKGASTTWNAGVTVNGTVIAQLLAVNGVNADWLNAGNITVGGNNNPGSLKIKNSSNNDVVISDTQGVKAKNGGYFISYGDEDTFAEDDLYPYSLLNMGNIELGYKKYGPNTLIATTNLRPYGKISLGEESDYYQDSAESVDIGFAIRTNPKLVMRLGHYTGTNLATFVSYILLQYYSLDPVEPYDSPGTDVYCNVTVEKNLGCQLNLYVSGQKHRVVQTDNYGKRLHCCYETPSPYFGDIGTGETDENGECYIFIDDIMRETICNDTQYVVFLQKEGPGDIWISKKSVDYFVVSGTPNLSFSWELKAKQRDYSSERLEEFVRELGEDIDYASDGNALIEEYIKQSEDFAE